MNRLATALLFINCIFLGWIAFRIEYLVPARSLVSAPQTKATPDARLEDDDLKREAWPNGASLLKKQYGREICKGCGYELPAYHVFDDYVAANIRVLDNGNFLMGFTYEGRDVYGNKALRMVSGEITNKDGKWSLVKSNNQVVR